MKKLVFTAVVLAVAFGVSSSADAFWGFSKKANKAEVENTQSTTEGILAINGGSEAGKLLIKKEGTAGFSLLAGGAVVKSNTAGTLTTEISFGSSKVNLTIKTNADTKVFRHFGGKGALFGVADIAVNDILSVEGSLDTAGGSLTVIAKKVQDYSAQARDASYSGTIKTLGTITGTTGTFVLDLANNDRDLTVVVNASTTIKKLMKKDQLESLVPIPVGDLRVGDIVKNARGVANTQTMTLLAKEIIISERDIAQRKIKDVFATVVSVDQGNSMVVKTTAGVVYTVSFKNSATSYYKWTISKRFSGKKVGTDGVSTVSTLDGLSIKAEDKVWVDGTVDTKTNIVEPIAVHKEFYK